MNLRMTEMVAPLEAVQKARGLLEEKKVMGMWTEKLDDGYSNLRILSSADQTETISDMLSEKFSSIEGFRIMLSPVEATIPQPEVNEEEEVAKDAGEEIESPGRISREELYTDVTEGSELTPAYMGLVVLSTVVAGTGLILDDVATIIGAMAIAPLLVPNVSFSLASTLGDLELGWRSLKVNAAGFSAVLVISIAMGMLFTVEPGADEMISRTMVSLKHIIIALAAGSAGALAFTRGTSASIIGVMVAVALLPPLVVLGLLLGAGYLQLAVGAAILTFANLICINLAGVVTFLAMGVGPRGWLEEKKAKKSTRLAIATWLILLLVFVVIIWYWGQFDVQAMLP